MLSAPIRRSTLTTPVDIGVFNARSIHNKTAAIRDWISFTKLKLAAVVKTWHDSRDCPDLIACAPPGFHYIERAQPRSVSVASDVSEHSNHGGVCLFFHRTLHAKRVVLVDYKSFEYVAVYITGLSMTLLAIVLYRPGSQSVSVQFFDEFANLLERTVTYASSLIIAGDVNIHLDDAANPATSKFMDILDSYGLAQHVTGATHHAGHCLDFLITRQELCVRSVIVDPPASSVSDHSTIVAQLDLQVPQDHSTVVRLKRC